MKKTLLLILTLGLVFQSCRKDEITTTTTTQEPTVENKYQIDIFGVVVDENDDPIENAVIIYDSQDISTNEFGLFQIKNVKTGDKSGVYLPIYSSGFYDGGVRVYANNTNEKFVKVELIAKEVSGIINGNTGGEVAVSNGGKIVFSPNSIGQDGNPYDGNIIVYSYYLDPSKDGFLQRSPGDLSAINSENNIVSLQSYGMMSVELEGENGEKLNILDGHLATIDVPIPQEMISNAKNEIPLWHFDEQLGRWVEEGVAFLNGDKYVGEVSHFSWWNCDDPFLATNLCVNVIQLRNNTPLENQLVVLITDSWGIASDYTDENGVVCGLIPSNVIFTLEIRDECGNVVYSTEIGPFTDPTNEITIQINDQSIDYFSVSGTVTDCTGTDPLTNAYIKAISDYGSFYTTTDENGDYYLEGVFCEETDLIITAIDAVAGLSGFSTITDLDSEDYQVDLSLCEESPFIVLEEDGVVVFTSGNCEAKLKPHELLIYDENGSNFIMGVVGAVGVGSYQANLLYPNQIAEEGNLTVTITSFGALGGIVKGTFVGTTALNNSINGSFVAIRVE